MSLATLRQRIEAFVERLEEERYRVEAGYRDRARFGELYGAAVDLFSPARITEVQRALAGSAGVEERATRALLEFLGLGRAMSIAARALDERTDWEISGSIALGEGSVRAREVEAAIAGAATPDARKELETALLDALEEHAHLAEDFLLRHRDGLGELGYGSHVETLQILGGIDLEAIGREADRFLAETEDAHRELLAWHLPRVAEVDPQGATVADGLRLRRAAHADQHFGGHRYREVLDSLAAADLDPNAEGRLSIDPDAPLAAGRAVLRAPRVPGLVRLAVSRAPGRESLASFLRALGAGLHQAYTDPTLSVEQRCLGDASVPEASGALFHSMLRTPEFLRRVLGVSRDLRRDHLRLEAFLALFEARRDAALLRYELEFHRGQGPPEVFATMLEEATGLRHDPRYAPWSVDPEIGSARRIRAAQLGAIHANVVRNRFDEDWFRNPAASGYLRDLFSNGRRYSSGELAVQLGSRHLGYDVLKAEIDYLLGISG